MDEDDGLRVAVGSLPAGVEQQGLDDGGIRGNKDGLNVPVVEDCPPAAVEVDDGVNALPQEVVSVEIVFVKVSAAVSKDAILRIEFPDRVASPVVVNEKPFGLIARVQELDGFLGKLPGLADGLLGGEVDPSDHGKEGQQSGCGHIERGPEARWSAMRG